VKSVVVAAAAEKIENQIAKSDSETHFAFVDWIAC
jgi:hypothetical protein